MEDTNAAAAGPDTSAEQPSADAAHVVGAIEQAAPPPDVFRLNLDHDSVYWGAEKIAAANVREGDVVLNHEPDNSPGRYKWNSTANRLDALPSSQVKTAPAAPTLEQAFHSIIESLEAAGHALPAAAAAWRDEFKKTIDRLGAQ